MCYAYAYHFSSFLVCFWVTHMFLSFIELLPKDDQYLPSRVTLLNKILAQQNPLVNNNIYYNSQKYINKRLQKSGNSINLILLETIMMASFINLEMPKIFKTTHFVEIDKVLAPFVRCHGQK
ncbi:hypothetical protein BDF20DRAFT_833504 [Mycotypha africana]|uniref:uncharacterized protein n=1 Tax=Mycotypha africana TaxID=64632 RepID=UPI00230010BA|nr:uncharacterized protein BDF20DRAFT_833504 [Mycotypha africana]KAI8983950.1 hypothetical protein BDF20DRAFT_833504 [Mycotypha africana]